MQPGPSFLPISRCRRRAQPRWSDDRATSVRAVCRLQGFFPRVAFARDNKVNALTNGFSERAFRLMPPGKSYENIMQELRELWCPPMVARQDRTETSQVVHALSAEPARVRNSPLALRKFSSSRSAREIRPRPSQAGSLFTLAVTIRPRIIGKMTTAKRFLPFAEDSQARLIGASLSLDRLSAEPIRMPRCCAPRPTGSRRHPPRCRRWRADTRTPLFLLRAVPHPRLKVRKAAAPRAVSVCHFMGVFGGSRTETFPPYGREVRAVGRGSRPFTQ